MSILVDINVIKYVKCVVDKLVLKLKLSNAFLVIIRVLMKNVNFYMRKTIVLLKKYVSSAIGIKVIIMYAKVRNGAQIVKYLLM
jgi:hypothetical protein